jgi:hypothetical protein
MRQHIVPDHPPETARFPELLAEWNTMDEKPS